MSGPWEKFASAEAPQDTGPWSKFSAQPQGTTWGEVARGVVSNFGKSAKENIVEPILGGAEMMSPDRVVRGAFEGKLPAPVEAAKQLVTHPVDSLKRVRDLYTERYGSMEGFKKALRDDPLAIGMDAFTLLSAGDAAGLKLGKLAKGAATKVASGPANVAAATAGHLSGVSPEAIKQAVKEGYTRDLSFIDSLKGKLPAEETVKMAAKAVGKMREERRAQYRAAMKVLGQETEEIKPDKILQGWQDAQKFGHLEGTDFATTERSAGLDKRLVDVLEEWYQKGQTQPDKFFTPQGLDALKRRVRSIKNNIPFEAREDRAYVGSLESFIRDQISEQVPTYDKIMKDYAEASDGLEEIEKSLSLGDKATYDSGIRKLLSAMRNNANSNYGNRLKMVDTLEKYGAKGLKSRLSGMSMSSPFPRGLAGRNPGITTLASLVTGHPEIMALLAAESPALMGRALYSAGALSRMAAPIGTAAAKGTTPLWAADLLKQMGGQNAP